MKNKSTQKVQPSLAQVDHYPHIAWSPDLESQQISIRQFDKGDVCSDLAGVLNTILE